MEKYMWNLNGLFVSDEDFEKEIKNLKKDILFLNSKQNSNSENLYYLLEDIYSIKKRTNNILIYGSLKYYQEICDKNNELKTQAEQLENFINAETNFIKKLILEKGKEKIEMYKEEFPKLKKYAFLFDNIFRKEEHKITEDANGKMFENNQTINNSLKEHNKLLHELDFGQITIDNKAVDLNLGNIAKYVMSRDRKTREMAYEKLSLAYVNEEENFNNIFNDIYLKRIENSNILNYNTNLEKSLFEENIDDKVVFSLIKTVKENLNFFQEYLTLKSEKLNIENPFLYDLSVPLDSKIDTDFPIEKAFDIIKEVLAPLGEEYLNVLNLLIENNHFELLPKKEKHQTLIFSWSDYAFMNYKGGYNDLKKLIHEVGHVVNAYLSKQKQPFIYEDSDVFVGETASIMNEILLDKYLLSKSISEEEKEFYLSKQIEGFISLVYKQTLYTEFENDCYNLIENGDFSLSSKNKVYNNLLKKYYSDVVNYDCFSDKEWMRLGHIYRHEYYVYKYATGLLMANIVLENLEKNKIPTDDYIKFLESGANDYPLNLLKKLKVDLTDKKDLEKGFKILSKNINDLKKCERNK